MCSVLITLFLQVDWLETIREMPPEMGPWIYALLARLEKPLHPDMVATIRSLAFECSRQRAKIISGDRSDLSMVTPLTLFICIVAKYFSQADIAD